MLCRETTGRLFFFHEIIIKVPVPFGVNQELFYEYGYRPLLVRNIFLLIMMNYRSHFGSDYEAVMQSSLLAFAVLGKQAEESREQRQARQRAQEERKREALELLGLPWPETTRKGPGRPTFEDQYKAAL